MRELVIDVSRHDRGIDLAAWRDAHGVWGVIVKMGGHEYLRNSDGSLDSHKTFYEDSQRDAHYGSATSIGLHVGAYYYGTATSAQEARDEARHCLDILGGRFCDLPVYYDVEEPEQLGMDDLYPVVCAFCDAIEAAGYRAGIYSGREGFSKMGDVDRYALWAASWRDSWPSWASTYGMWQQGSMRLSDGDIEYGDADGYTDFDWCQIDYPAQRKNGGGSVARISIADVAARIHYDMVTDERNGYNQQPERWGGDYGGDKTLTINGRNYTYALGSYDCSSSTITAWQLALQGTPYEGALDGATYTGDMRSVFVNSGLFYAEYSPAKRGDLYLAEGSHVAMCQDGGSDGVFGYDCLTEFNRNENHAASWGEPGDQDGYESILRDYYDDGWNTVLHYNGKADYDVQQPKPSPKPHQEPGNPKNDAGLGYQAHVQDIGWLPEVRDGQTAGTVGYGKRLEAIRFTSIPAGWSISAKAHIANIGWRDFGMVKAGDVIGTTGKGCAIENLMLDAVTPNGDRRKLHYQVHQENVGWKGVTPEGFASGTDGMGLRLEAVRIWLA